MSFDLVHENTQFDLKAPDHLNVKLNYNDLIKLKVKYVFTLRSIDDDLKSENIKFDKIFTDKQIYIYKKPIKFYFPFSFSFIFFLGLILAQ